ncbi:MAG: hypothetical protein WCK38_00355 [Candidatus Omnitrophota bacterium]
MTIFSRLPEWACFIATLIFVQFSHEVGFRIGTRRRLKPGDNPETSAGTISGTVIGLLAFLLAFTFNGASSHYDLRKELIIEEANAVRTTYQRSLQLPAPYRAKVRDLLEEYVDIRLKVRGFRKADLSRALARTLAIQDDLWSVVLTLQQKEPNTPMLVLFTQSLNEVFDLHVKRVNAVFQSRISIFVWSVLYLLTFITMAMMGYRIGLSGLRSTFMELTLALAFSSVLIVIVSLDRPNGWMRVDPKSLIDVLNMLRAGG